MGNGSKKGAGEEIAAKGAGIFGKAAEELFELPNKAGKRIHFLRPIKSNHVHARGYRLPRLKKAKNDPSPNMSRPVTRSRTCGTPSTSPGATTRTPAETTPPTGTSTRTGMRESSSPATEKRTKKSREIQTVRLSLRAAGRSFPTGPIESKKHSQDHRGVHRTIALQHHLPAMRRLTL